MNIEFIQQIFLGSREQNGNINNDQYNIREVLPDAEGKLFAMEVNTQIARQAGIEKGDQIIVDREISPSNGNMVVARIGNDLCIRKLIIENGKKALISPGNELAPLAVDSSFMCWGVIIYVVKSLIRS